MDPTEDQIFLKLVLLGHQAWWLTGGPVAGALPRCYLFRFRLLRVPKHSPSRPGWSSAAEIHNGTMEPMNGSNRLLDFFDNPINIYD